MNDEALLKRIGIINDDLYEWKQNAILHRDLATKAQEKNALLRGLLTEVRQLLDAIYAEDIVSSGDLGKVYEKIERELAE